MEHPEVHIKPKMAAAHPVAQTAEKLVELALQDAALIVAGDPLQLVSPIIADLSHTGVIQTATLLLKRLSSTVSAGGVSPALAPLAAVAAQKALPALEHVRECISKHHSFQSAFALTPLLARAVALAAQCCGLAARGAIVDAEAVSPFIRMLTALAEVLSHGVADRIERFRPLDAKRVAWTHRAFADLQLEASQQVSKFLGSAATSSLAPIPPACEWEDEELQLFWEQSCTPKYGESAPQDALAVLLLKAASQEASNESREKLMRRFLSLDCRTPGFVMASELNRWGERVKAAGGLDKFVCSLLREDDDPLKFRSIAPTASMQFTSSRSSKTSTAKSLLEPRAKSFALTAPTPRSCRSDGGNSILNDLSHSTFHASQKLILGDKTCVYARGDVFKDTPLHLAATHDHRHGSITAMLLRNGGDANAEDKHLATPLHTAAVTGHTEVAKQLIGHGADVCKEDRWRVTPLHKAAANGQLRVTDMLLQGGACASTRDDWGSTPLHKAAANGQLSVAERLLESGLADANAEDLTGDRPLHLAAKSGHYAVARLLLEKGGSRDARSRGTGRTPADCARERGHVDVVTLLRHWAEWGPSGGREDLTATSGCSD